jgi:hypothetical protein
MTDAVAIEAPAEPVPVLAAPDVAAELEAAAPDAAASPAEAPAAAAERVMPEIEHPIGSLRQAVLDALIDNEGPRTVSQIIAHMPVGTSRNSGESAIKREFDSGRIVRTSPGHYRLAPVKPAEPPKPTPTPDPPKASEDNRTTEQWFALLEAWDADPSCWNVERDGPPPDQPDCRVLLLIKVRFADRLRKREERRKDREAAAAKQTEADAALRAKLIAGCFGNVTLGAGINDLAPIKAMLADGVPLEHVLIGLKRVTDRRIDPKATPISSWREPRVLESVARSVLLGGLLPRLVDAWSKAGIAPQKPTDASEASARSQERP